jgi:CheY-like chemotaxis protein
MENILIMLIDDDPLTNQLNTLVINRQTPDAEIITFTMANNAINYLREEGKRKPEIIFLDLNMPLMNGWDFMEEYQKLSLDIEVVILTSSNEEEEKKKSNSYKKISSYELKPLSLNKFAYILQKKIR